MLLAARALPAAGWIYSMAAVLASVSGFYLAHPDRTYFNVGKIGEDQVFDMAERRGLEEADVARMLAPNLG